MSFRQEVLLWMKQAENDLQTSDWDSAAFWSHQAAEKALKALLFNHGKTYRGNDRL